MSDRDYNLTRMHRAEEQINVIQKIDGEAIQIDKPVIIDALKLLMATLRVRHERGFR